MTAFASSLACGGDDGTDDAAGSTGADPTGDPTGDPSGNPTGNPSTDDGSTSIDPSTDDGSTSIDPTEGGTTAVDETAGTTAADETAGTTGGVSAECQTYCDLYMDNCAEGQGGSTPYGSEDECFAACAAFSMAGLECRTGHLDGSLTGNPPLDDAYYETHCPHGSAGGGGVCMD